MKRVTRLVIFIISLFTFYLSLITPALGSTVALPQGLPQGTFVNLNNYFLPQPGKPARISSGELFWIKPGQNGEYIQCTNDPCTNFQKIFPIANGFGIQGENHWNQVDNTTFQYRQGTFRWDDPNINPEQYPHATWLPSTMQVGDTHASGPVTVVGFIISPDPNEGIIQRCDSQCNNTSAGNTSIGTRLTYVGPVDFGNSVYLDDVAIVDIVYGPGSGEKFYFAKDIGWVGWEYNGASNIITELPDGSFPTDTSPAKPPTSRSSPTPQQKCTKEECAVYNFNLGTLPKEIIPQAPKDGGFATALINEILGWAKVFWEKPFQGPKLYVQSESVHQSNLPQELKPNSDKGGIVEKIKGQFTGFLGGSTGFYGANLPQEVRGGEVKDTEQAFEKSYFPEGIKPITGQ